ncbi:MAG: cyclic nucleotide-binding domain-containing protein [Proteobacteria bacterium]|nr:cyclic nucleotide-binding domain-containing protein [Pseudomonadota bacterium]MBU1581126.1 cyclic nucleotide-binding domain-containing protein [Pseudomonadota bacterium]MBU2630000.1 cyclic nucleotide-binding domain-containing protein [Pseudomonadota bacterium]
MGEGYTVKIANTREEIERIRHYSDQVYRLDGVKVHGVDETDLLHTTQIFYALESDANNLPNQICGTIRYTLDSDKGFPFEKAVFQKADTSRTPIEKWQPISGTEHRLDISHLRSGNPYDPGLVNYGMLALSSKHRVAARLYEVLMKLCVVHSIKNGAKKAIITINHAIEKTMEKFGFTRLIADTLYSPGIGNYIVVMTADLTSAFFSRIDLTLPDNVAIFSGSEIFRIIPRNVEICKQGDTIDRKVYLVVSGSVRVEVSKRETKLIALIGPGEIFGEMALIDDKPRSADVISNHRHVILQELANLNETVISQTPEIFFEFASMLSRRIRALNEKVKRSGPFAPEKFKPIPLPDTLLDYINNKQSTEFTESELICRQGDSSDGMYLINKGRIAISLEMPDGSDLLLGIAEAGTLVGEMGVIEGTKRSATMIACEVVRAIEIKRDELIELISTDWKVGHFLLRTVVQKLRATDEVIAQSVMIKPNLHRDFKQILLSIAQNKSLISAINDAFNDTEVDEEDQVLYDLKWVSDELGVPICHLDAMLRQLEKGRAIKTDPITKEITVIDEVKLTETKLVHDLTA